MIIRIKEGIIIRDNLKNSLNECGQLVQHTEKILEDYQEVHSYLNEKREKLETSFLKGLIRVFRFQVKAVIKKWRNQAIKFNNDNRKFINVIIPLF